MRLRHFHTVIVACCLSVMACLRLVHAGRIPGELALKVFIVLGYISVPLAAVIGLRLMFDREEVS